MKTSKTYISIIALSVFAVSINAQTPNDPHDYYDGYYFADGTENPAAFTDGNPSSSTARTTHQIATDNAIPDAFETVDSFDDVGVNPASDIAQGPSSIGFVVGRGKYTAGETDGSVSSFAVPLGHKFSNRFSLNASLPVQYTRVKDTDFRDFPPSTLSVWSGGVLISGAYGIAIPEDKKSYRWKVTPTVGLAWMDASGIDVGSWSLVGGISSSFLYKLNDYLILNIGNSFIAYHSQKLHGDYNELSQKDQAQLVNGVQLIMPYKRLVFNLFVMDNRYLQDAAVKDYQTYGLGAGYRIGKKASLRLFYFTDQGSDYEAHSFGISSAWKF